MALWNTAFVKKPAPTKPIPISRVIRPASPKFDEYLALAKELDVASVNCGKVLQREVADFLRENNIDMYRVDEVIDYLAEMAPKGENIYWRPLRDADRKNAMGYMIGAKKNPGYYYDDEWNCRTYDEPVPYEVLQNVKALVEKFGDKIQFFVTDYASSVPDPFIMLTARDMSLIVFGVWDKPKFFTKQI